MNRRPSTPTPVTYEPDAGAAHLDVVELDDLRRRATLDRIERIQFHLLIVVTGGSGEHMVDFEMVDLSAGDVVHIAPGQIHQWSRSAGYAATLVLFPDTPIPIGLPTAGVRHIHPSRADYAHLSTLLDLARAERHAQRSRAAAEIAQRAVRDLVVVCLDLAHSATTTEPALPAHRSFIRDLEEDLDVRTTLDERALRVGYSARTISRACRAATGASPKQLTDERLGLEARRLLSLPDTKVGSVARSIGFRDDSNFVAWFRRLHGTTPGRWTPSPDSLAPDVSVPGFPTR